jgi:hypothetical protein
MWEWDTDRLPHGMESWVWRPDRVTFGPTDFGTGAAADGCGRPADGCVRPVPVRDGNRDIGKNGTSADAADTHFTADIGADYWPRISR